MGPPSTEKSGLNLQIKNKSCLQIFSPKPQTSGVKNYKKCCLQIFKSQKLDLQIFSLKNSSNLANLQSSAKYAGSP